MDKSPDKSSRLDLLFEDEEQLWNSFKAGDIDAYEQIFKLFYKDLFGYGLKICSCPDITRDCIQTLFVNLWERKDHLSEAQSIKAYLLASLRRKILKTLGRERGEADTLKNRASEAMIQFSIEDSLIRDELKKSREQALQEAFGCLSDRQREILFLKYYNGMSYNEIEEILSINNQSVRNHIYRALQQIRQHFRKEEVANIISLLLLSIPAIV